MLFLTHKNQAKALCEGIQIKGLEKEFYHGKFHYNQRQGEGDLIFISKDRIHRVLGAFQQNMAHGKMTVLTKDEHQMWMYKNGVAQYQIITANGIELAKQAGSDNMCICINGEVIQGKQVGARFVPVRALEQFKKIHGDVS